MHSSFSLLQELARMEKERFRSDPHRVASAKYNLLVAIEVTIATGNHH